MQSSGIASLHVYQRLFPANNMKIKSREVDLDINKSFCASMFYKDCQQEEMRNSIEFDIKIYERTLN